MVHVVKSGSGQVVSGKTSTTGTFTTGSFSIHNQQFSMPFIGGGVNLPGIKAAVMEPWRPEHELSHLSDEAQALIKSWSVVVIESDEQMEEVVWYCLTKTKGRHYLDDHPMENAGVVWFEDKTDAVYVKLAFGGNV